jgi:hypothetical protein
MPAEIAENDPVFEDVRDGVRDQQLSERVFRRQDLTGLHGTLASFKPGNAGDMHHGEQQCKHVREEPADTVPGLMAHAAETTARPACKSRRPLMNARRNASAR